MWQYCSCLKTPLQILKITLYVEMFLYLRKKLLQNKNFNSSLVVPRLNFLGHALKYIQLLYSYYFCIKIR